MSSHHSECLALFGNRFAPITQAIGFVEAPIASVIDADRVWRRGIGKYPIRPLVGGLADALSSLLPLTGPQSRYIWVATTNGSWTAYFDNSRNGSDPWSPIRYLARTMRCRGIAILWAPQTRKSYGGTRFDLYSQRPADAPNIRTVSAINDGGRWVWTAIGQAQPFEETDAYLAKRVRDRLSPEMLDRYCQALGIRPFDLRYYNGQGLLVTNGNLQVKPLEESIAEAHARMDIQVQA